MERLITFTKKAHDFQNVYFLSFEVKRIRQKISSYCCNVSHAIVVCVCMRTLVRCRAGGGKKLAIVIAFLENSGLAGGRGAAAALDWPGLVCRY